MLKKKKQEASLEKNTTDGKSNTFKNDNKCAIDSGRKNTGFGPKYNGVKISSFVYRCTLRQTKGFLTVSSIVKWT